MSQTVHSPLRQCEGCQACCEAKKIPALNLSAWQSCPHQSSTGCANYSQRPDGCRYYTCVWVDGWGTEKQRPDRIQMIFELAAGPFGGMEVRGIELKARAEDTPSVKEALQDWIHSGVKLSILKYRT